MLRLYVAGSSRNSMVARENLRALSAKLPGDAVTVEVIDVFQDSQRALDDGIRVTPTLVRLAPRPARVIVGDLSDTIAVCAALGIAAGGA